MMQGELGADFNFYARMLQRFIYLETNPIDLNKLLREYSLIDEKKCKRNANFEEILLLSK